ncbi:MAG: hypothetical protein MZV49_10440 [Rhodopseudomonas palustris]|nr:hypothetical protein [Rhodopseudomonas palustris]
MTADGPALDDRAVRSKLAHWAVKDSGLKYTSYRAVSALSKGQRPGSGEFDRQAGRRQHAARRSPPFAMELDGAAGVLSDPAQAGAGGRFQAMLLSSPAMRIAGGTDEISAQHHRRTGARSARRHSRRQGRAVQSDPDPRTLTVRTRARACSRSRCRTRWDVLGRIEACAGSCDGQVGVPAVGSRL